MSLEANPWKTLSSTLLVENPWFRVREHTVIRPDGNPGTYTVVEPRKLATGVVALNEHNEVYLVGQFRYPTDRYSWEIIEGGSDEGECALDAAKRELREEAGLQASYWVQLGGEIHVSNCISSEVGFLFLARGLVEVGAQPDGTEILQLRKIPLNEGVQMALSGELQDAMSIIGLVRAQELLRGM